MVRVLHEAMRSSLEFILTVLQSQVLLCGSLAKAQGLNAEIQGSKYGVSYVQVLWTPVRGAILSLSKQEKTFWNLNMYRGYWSDLYQMKMAVATLQKKATA